MREGWKLGKLGDFSAINYGYTAKATFENVGPKFLRITDIQNGNVDWLEVPNCPISQKEFERHVLHDKDIVFARTGATTGKSFLLHDPPQAVAASYLIRLRVENPKVLPEFVALYFQSKDYWDTVFKGMAGSAQGGFNASKVKNLRLPIPPLPEQKRIVAILDEAFAGIERAVANTEKNLANARELFESYLNSIFGGFGVFRKLGDICENLDSRWVPITKTKRKPGNIPYYGASGIVDYVQDFLFDEDLLLVSEDGANLLARTYPIAFSISGKTWVNNHAHVLRFSNFTSQKFIEFYLNSISLAPFVSGMAQPKLNQKALNSIPVPFPKIEQQEEAVGKLQDVATQTDEIVKIYGQKLAALSDLKQSLLQKAFSGELTAEKAKTETQRAVA